MLRVVNSISLCDFLNAHLQLGSMVTVEDAAKIGLVDDVVAPELVFDKSVEMALKFAALPSVARHRSKVRKRRLRPNIDAVLCSDSRPFFVLQLQTRSSRVF
jgi:enoyl-CoA hydratase/carnithine racemase